MGAFRNLIASHRRLVAVLLLATLCLKVLVPAGNMISVQDRVLTVSICADASGDQLTRQIVIPGKQAPADHSGNAKGECAFSALSMAALGGAEPALLAAALAFILALGFAPQRGPAHHAFTRLRPPTRGPPLAA